MSEHEHEPVEPVDPDTTPGDEPDVDPDADPDAPDEQPDGQRETQGEPAARQRASDDDVEAKMAKVARSATTFRNAVSRVLGEDANYLHLCPLCEPNLPGFMWSPEDTTPRDETHGRLLLTLLRPVEPAYLEAPDAQPCSTCDALGQVRTGSKVPNQETKMCPACRGAGWVAKGDPVGNGHAEPAPTLAERIAVGPQSEPDDVDAWGSPRLLPTGMPNPNYGRMPQYRDPSYP